MGCRISRTQKYASEQTNVQGLISPPTGSDSLMGSGIRYGGFVFLHCSLLRGSGWRFVRKSQPCWVTIWTKNTIKIGCHSRNLRFQNVFVFSGHVLMFLHLFWGPRTPAKLRNNYRNACFVRTPFLYVFCIFSGSWGTRVVTGGAKRPSKSPLTRSKMMLKSTETIQKQA